jgi:saccharopine dehydrogenase-like NADP-dependent oxidoreductase
LKNQILLLGAGKSSAHLIQYLAQQATIERFRFLIMDIDISLIPTEIDALEHVAVVEVSSKDINFYSTYIAESGIVISMLPAFMHIDIAKMCLTSGVHLITPSYISADMKAMEIEVKSKGLIFLNEMGFDPGIDHMTTMKIYHEIEAEGGRLTLYKSYAGGLVAPKNDNNPWNYKFSWNPRNVILAGQGGEIIYKENREKQTLTYAELFAKSELLILTDGSSFDAYANRDSLKYEELYQWQGIDTLLRGTLRKPGFCEGWNVLIQLGMTDNEKQIEAKGKTYQEFYQLFLTEKISDFLVSKNENVASKLIYIGFQDAVSIIEKNGTAAEILQSILEQKWKLMPTDTDWVVMAHIFEYEINGTKTQLESRMSLEGETSLYTAMSKTVGMPIAFAAMMIYHGQIYEKGVLMPTNKEIYEPILSQLNQIGIEFIETKKMI